MFFAAVDLPENRDVFDAAMEAIKKTAGDVRELGFYYSHGD